MRNQIHAPPELVRRTKAEAALRGKRLKDLVVEALEDKLRAKPTRKRGWRVAFGRVPRAAVVDVDLRVATDLERIDAREWE